MKGKKVMRERKERMNQEKRKKEIGRKRWGWGMKGEATGEKGERIERLKG